MSHRQKLLEELLVLTSWLTPTAGRRSRITDILGEDPDILDVLVPAARHHGTVPWLARTLVDLVEVEAVDLADINPAYALLVAEATGLETALRHRMRELGIICDAASRQGMPPVVLKGPAWEIEFYESRYTRGSVDFDLLVPRDQFDRFGELLVDLGYAQGTFSWNTRRVTKVSPQRAQAALDSGRHATPYVRFDVSCGELFIVELHGPLNDENFHHIDTTPMLRDTRPLRIGEAVGRQLSMVDSLIYAAAHLHKNLYKYAPAGKPSLPYLKWFCDVRQMFLCSPDDSAWVELYPRAASLRQVNAVYFAVHHTNSLFPGVIPDSVLAAPALLSRPVAEVVDDRWTFSHGSSTFWQRLFEPYRDAERYRALRSAGLAGGRLSIPDASEAPALNGCLTGPVWSRLDFVTVSGANPAPAWQYFRSHVSFGVTPASDEDFSARFAVCRFGEYLYVGFAVKDRMLTFTQRTGFYHEQDCVQILFETPFESGDLTNLIIVPRAADLNGPAVMKHYADSDRMGTYPVSGAEAGAIITGTGYTITVAIPLNEVGLDRSATTFGFDAVFYDANSDGTMRRTVLQWSGGRNNLRYPAYFGTAEFSGNLR